MLNNCTKSVEGMTFYANYSKTAENGKKQLKLQQSTKELTLRTATINLQSTWSL